MDKRTLRKTNDSTFDNKETEKNEIRCKCVIIKFSDIVVLTFFRL